MTELAEPPELLESEDVLAGLGMHADAEELPLKGETGDDAGPGGTDADELPLKGETDGDAGAGGTDTDELPDPAGGVTLLVNPDADEI